MAYHLTPQQSAKIANLGLVSACLVVALHVFTPSTATYSVKFVSSFFADGLGRMAVPFFFAVSGLLLARHYAETGWYPDSLRKRVFTLLIPYMIWNIAYAYMQPLFFVLVNGQSIRDCLIWSPCFLGLDPFNQPILGPTWYIRTLFLFLLCSPVLFWLIRRFNVRFLVFSFIIVLILYVPNYRYYGTCKSLQFLLFSLEGLLYFIAGAYLGIHDIHKTYIGKSHIALLLIASILITVLRIVSKHFGYMFVYYHLRELVIPGYLIFAIYLTPSSPWPKWLTGLSFPIYLIHPFMISFLNHILPRQTTCTIPGYLLFVFLSIVLSACAALAIKSPPPYHGFQRFYLEEGKCIG